MRLLRGAVAGLLLLNGACLLSRDSEAPRPAALPRPVSTTVPSTTTTQPPPVTVPPTLVPHAQRASRSRSAPRPAVAVAATPPPEGCNSWATKTRAQSDACWGPLVEQYAATAGWSVAWALRVIYCESRGNPYARNPRSSATGLFQILHGPTDPEANVSLAASMYRQRGSQPWVCR